MISDEQHVFGFRHRRIIRCMASATPASRSTDRAPVVPVHAEPLTVLWERTGSRPGGLTAEEVRQRRGTAAVRTEGSRTMAVLGELVESVVEPLQVLLVVVGMLSAIFGELRDAIAIFAIIALVSAVEAISEVRAKRALRALRDLSAPNALVRRDSAVAAVPVDAVVIGGALLVGAGRRGLGAGRAAPAPPAAGPGGPTPCPPGNPGWRGGLWRPPRDPSRSMP